MLEDVEKMRRKSMIKESDIEKNRTITSKEFDEKFDRGEDISEYLDFSKAIRPNALNTNTRKVNIDFPEWIIEALDKEAKKIGVTRQSIIKVWIAQRLKEETKKS